MCVWFLIQFNSISIQKIARVFVSFFFFGIFFYFQQFTTFAFVSCVNFKCWKCGTALTLIAHFIWIIWIRSRWNFFGIHLVWITNVVFEIRFICIRILTTFAFDSSSVRTTSLFWMNFHVTFRIIFFAASLAGKFLFVFLFQTWTMMIIMWLNTVYVYIWKCGTTTIFTCDFLNVVCTEFAIWDMLF